MYSAKLKILSFFRLLIPHSQCARNRGLEIWCWNFFCFFLFSYPLLEKNNHKTQKIISGHPMTLTLTFILRYLEIYEYMNNFVERIGGTQFLTDFDETWSIFFIRSISRISSVHIFWFLPYIFIKCKIWQPYIKKWVFGTPLHILPFCEKMRQKLKKVDGRNFRYRSYKEIDSGFIKIG